MLQQPRRPSRQDTFDLRGSAGQQAHDRLRGQQQQQVHHQGVYHDEDHQYQQHGQHYYSLSDEEGHSVMEDDSDNDMHGGQNDFVDEEDDGSSSLSIPDESINFDLVYSLHTFVATVEGQANVIKGDSLCLVDDSNSYWWLVRVLRTNEIGYIPAENIETPFERLARLNKHRNVDLASATQAERQDDARMRELRMRNAYQNPNRKTVIFTAPSIFTYPPALWGDEQESDEDYEGGWGDDGEEGYESYEDDENMIHESPQDMEPDDGISWEDGAVEEEQRRRAAELQQQQILQQQQQQIDDRRYANDGRNGQESPVQQRQTSGSSGVVSSTSQLGIGLASSLRKQLSRDQVDAESRDTSKSTTAQSGQRTLLDPAEVTTTRQIIATPAIARGSETNLSHQSETSFPSDQSTPRQNTVYRTVSTESGLSDGTSTVRNDNDSDYSKNRKASKDSVRLRKNSTSSGRLTPDNDSGNESGKKEKKKSGGIFSGIFSSKKSKDKKDKRGISSEDLARASDDSGTSSPLESSPSNNANHRSKTSSDSMATSTSSSQSHTIPSGMSSHGFRVQQQDQAQQALYTQYLKRSPSNPPDAILAYGLQTSATQPYNDPHHLAPTRLPNGRPGSLVLSPSAADGPQVPELSVMRVFAGENLQSDATFKTVLLNVSTSSTDLVKQAMQRFRLPNGEDAADYYLTIRKYEGHEAPLQADEKPLVVFEQLVEETLNIPTVKRLSISSTSSNLSTHPAITKLDMNDFADDSAVKFYLNRRPIIQPDRFSNSTVSENPASSEVSPISNNGAMASLSPHSSPLIGQNGRPLLSVDVAGAVAPERFSSPSARFPVQIMIFPDDLPDGLVFDPHTEAIIPKHSLQSRAQSATTASPGVNQTQRKKVLIFPRNTTVAEVIEQSLDMFGIQEGVVDGGDEVEDKLTKRRSMSSRVRYGLASLQNGQERELLPSMKVLDAFVKPPVFKTNPNRRSADLRRRSVDSSLLLGSLEDVQPSDPVFVLRRAHTYRASNRNSRLSAPLDDLALRQLHGRESLASTSSGPDHTPTQGNGNDSPVPPPKKDSVRGTPTQSQLELIAAQRAASRANQQKALLAQNNTEQGVDVVVPDKGTLRSTRSGPEERMRYSFIQPNGIVQDVSQIVESEWRDGAASPNKDLNRQGSRQDLLENVMIKPQDVAEQRIDQVLARIQNNGGNIPRAPSSAEGRPGAASPDVGRRTPVRQHSGTTLQSTPSSSRYAQSPRSVNGRITPSRPPIILQDDFGLSKMMTVIELSAASKKPQRPEQPRQLDPVDQLLFGPSLALDDLHPEVREIFAPSFQILDDMDQLLDNLLDAVFTS